MAMFPVRVRCGTRGCKWEDQLQVVKLPTEGTGSVVLVPAAFMCAGCRCYMTVETMLGKKARGVEAPKPLPPPKPKRPARKKPTEGDE